MEVITGYGFYIISRFFSGHEDGFVSQTEIELAGCRDNIIDKTMDTIRRGLWHKNGALKLIFTALAIAIWSFGFSYSSILMFFSVLSLQVVVFNPVIAVKHLDQGFFYIGDGKWEKHFKGNEKLYYFTNLAIVLAAMYFLR